jgi:predicted transcriptional regulator
LYLNLHGNHNVTEKDIDRFISLLEVTREQKANTISSYLGQLIPFFYRQNLKEVAELAKEQKNIFAQKARFENKYYPIPSKDLKDLYSRASKTGKVLIHLLLFEKMKILKIPAIHSKEDGYLYDGEDKRLHFTTKATTEVVKTFLESDENKNERLFTEIRQLDLYFEELTKPMKRSYPITAMNLRKFSRYIHKDDLIEWLASK